MSLFRIMPVVTLLLSISAVSNINAAGRRLPGEELYKPSTYKEMPYRLMNPLDFDSKKKYPIIVSLHGAGGRGE